MTQGFNEQSVLSDVVLPAALRQYQLKGIVAREHAGQIFAAWDTQLCRDVWIRRIHHQGENAAQILVQARLAAALKHPAFAKIHALEESAEDLFVIGEAMIGTPLLDWLGQNQGDHKAILNLVMQIATALAEAHQLGLVHGDIQPKQFLIDTSRQVRILNCGFVGGRSSTALSSIDQIDSSGGLAYFAPERFANSTATPASDVYALGTLLYQMLNGSLPFVHLQGLAMVAAMVQADAEKWPCRAEVSPALREWMLAMLKRQPEQRISCLEIVEQGRVIREAEGYSSTNSSINLQGLQGQLAELARRRKRNRILGAVLALSVIAGGVWLAKPDWPLIVKALRPFSESREFEIGIAALEQYSYNPRPKLLDQAEVSFARILEKKADNARAVGYMSVIYLSRYHSSQRDEIWLQKAKASAQQAMQLNPNLAISLVAEAKIAHWHHKYDETLKLVEQALKIEPQNLLAWHTKMSCLYESGRLIEAIAWGQQGAKNFPQDRFMLELKAVSHRALNDFPEAEAALRESLRRQPDFSNAYGILADTLAMQGKREEAMQVLQQGLQIKPNVLLFETLGKLRFQQGDFEGAVSAFKDAVSPDRGVTGSYSRWLNYGEALMWVENRNTDARSAFEMARKLLDIRLNRSPDDKYLLIDMAFLQARLGEKALAEKYVAQALQIDASDDYVLFYAGMIEELMGQRERAVSLIAKVKDNPNYKSRVHDHPALQSLRKDPRFNQ